MPSTDSSIFSRHTAHTGNSTAFGKGLPAPWLEEGGCVDDVDDSEIFLSAHFAQGSYALEAIFIMK